MTKDENEVVKELIAQWRFLAKKYYESSACSEADIFNQCAHDLEKILEKRKT